MDSCGRTATSPPWGICILGSADLPGHLSTLARDTQFRVIGIAGQAADLTHAGPGGLRQFPDADAAIRDADVDGVIICTNVDQRMHWARRAAEAGKPALCELPLVSSTAQARELEATCGSSNTPLAMVTDDTGHELARSVREALGPGGIGAPLYFDLHVGVPRAWIAGAREGVLLLHGYPYARLLTAVLGPLDTVLARTHSLRRNRPTEDIAVAMMRFVNGIEGVLHVDGLGEHPQVRMTVRGTGGSACLRHEIGMGLQRDLRCSYDDLANLLSGSAGPSHGVGELRHTMYTLDWIRQSARQNAELHRGDVRTS